MERLGNFFGNLIVYLFLPIGLAAAQLKLVDFVGTTTLTEKMFLHASVLSVCFILLTLSRDKTDAQELFDEKD